MDRAAFEIVISSGRKCTIWSLTQTSYIQNVDIDQGIHKGKMKVALNEKRKKLCGFSFSINIANFEAFLSVFKLTKNPLFLKSDMISAQ